MIRSPSPGLAERSVALRNPLRNPAFSPLTPFLHMHGSFAALVRLALSLLDQGRSFIMGKRTLYVMTVVAGHDSAHPSYVPASCLRIVGPNIEGERRVR